MAPQWRRRSYVHQRSVFSHGEALWLEVVLRDKYPSQCSASFYRIPAVLTVSTYLLDHIAYRQPNPQVSLNMKESDQDTMFQSDDNSYAGQRGSDDITLWSDLSEEAVNRFCEAASEKTQRPKEMFKKLLTRPLALTE